MMKKISVLSVLVGCLGSLAVSQAQETMMSPPKVLSVTREMIKPGKGAVHEKWEAGWPRAFAKAKWPVHYLAVASLTGQPRALFMTGYDSLAAWEKDAAAQEKNTALSAEQAALADKDGEYLTEIRNAVFLYMPELSYHPDLAVAGARYFRIYNITVKPGHDDHFVEARKVALAAHEKANLPDHFAVFHAIAGGPTTQYLIFIPMKSLAEVDEFPTVHGKAYKEALGEEGQKKLAEFDSQGVESSESQIFAFSPKMSYPPKEWVAADPDFWAPKAAPAAKPAAAKKEAPTQ
jgi:hypothetical protein